MKSFPLLAILGGCLLLFSCNKGGESVPLHDTTYVWGNENWSAVQPLDQKVPSSADSTSVRYVYLLNDGTPWHGTPTSWILRNLNMIIEPVSLENRHKIRGAGTLIGVGIWEEQHIKDSIVLAQMGFLFAKVRH